MRKKIATAMFILTAVFFLSACGGTQRVVLQVANMICPICEVTITSALQLSGIDVIQVSFVRGLAEFRYDPDEISLREIQLMLNDVGFPTRVR